MTKKTKYYGLCETCDHDATCKLRRCSQLKIIQCEEFTTQSKTRVSIPEKSPNEQLDSLEMVHMGLCANCLNVLACSFPDARNNVLQCEEYVLDETGKVKSVKTEYSRSAA